MSRLEELIQQLCPDGVEFKPLGEVCKLSRGRVYSKDYLQNNPGVYPVYSSQTANNGELGKINTYDCEGDYLTWTTDGAYAGTIFHRSGKFSITNVCGLIKASNPLITIRFLYYWLTITAKTYVYQGMGNPKLMTNQIEVIPIPLPPLPIQEEIVRILDIFTESTNNLKEQIQTRRKQYEYYRDQLLDLEGKEGVEWKPLNDVFEMKNGYTPSKAVPEYWEFGTIPWFRMEDIRQNGRILSDSIQHITPEAVKGGRLFPANSIILATTATIGEHALIIADSLANQRFTNLRIRKSLEHRMDMKFFFYYMFIIDAWCKKNVHNGGFASVDMEKLKKLEIPLPTKKVQQRIVDILDQFEASIANLEAQLKQREKQYEYYRNRLLDFKRKD